MGLFNAKMLWGRALSRTNAISQDLEYKLSAFLQSQDILYVQVNHFQRQSSHSSSAESNCTRIKERPSVLMARVLSPDPAPDSLIITQTFPFMLSTKIHVLFH